MRVPVRLGAASLALCAGLGALSACTSDQSSELVDGKVPVGSYRLVSFDSCEDALNGLRAAAKAAVGPYGLGGYAIDTGMGATNARGGAVAVPDAAVQGAPVPGAAPGAAAGQEAKAAAPESGQSNYSGTNTHEVGVDEPDLVKTDGRRIVTVSGSALKVVDATSHTVTASVDLGDFQAVPDDLLLSGNQALVLMRSPYFRGAIGGGIVDMPAEGATKKTPNDTQPIPGPRLVLVSLAGAGRVLSSVTVDGSLVDARQVGATARVVIRSSPRIPFPYQENLTEAQRLTANRGIIDQAPIDQWLPRIDTTTGNSTKRVPVDCAAVSRPAVYSGANLVTVLSFNLGAASLGDGAPTTLVADGDTVYSNGPSLYVASNQRAMARPVPESATPAPATSEIYRFDTTTPRPTFAAGGSVPGYLLNQYAMSEWDGKLRVATTTPAVTGQRSGSGVYVLAQDGKTLNVIGSVVGLGKGEQIYAVRFVGPTGYVVTFRQTDPLYTVDLRDPTKPAVRGELKIPGYSAYLHPAGDNKLIGIGQGATEQGRATGTQVSLFDVGNLDSPSRTAHYTLSGAHSEAEFDPHAFLFWPATGLLVVPLQTMSTVVRSQGTQPAKVSAEVGALVLRLSGQGIQEVGFIQHPGMNYNSQIRRSLVINQTLWTLSDAGLMASDLGSLARTAWIPLGA